SEDLDLGLQIWNSLDVSSRCAAVACAGWPLPGPAADLGKHARLDAQELRASLAELSWLGLLDADQVTLRLVPAVFERFVLRTARGPEVDRVRHALLDVLRAEAALAPTEVSADLRIAEGEQALALGLRKEAKAAFALAFDLAQRPPGTPATAMRAGELLIE